MERITPEQLKEEFGGRGVAFPTVVDLIRVDPETDTVVLLMVEDRDWSHGEPQLRQLQEKIDRYLGYVADGFFLEQYPQYAGKAVRFELDCAVPPHGLAKDMLMAAEVVLERYDIPFKVRVVGGLVRPE
ncbi:MAG: flagellar brake protein [Myxococcales bacterium]|nr:flagellar brake protein [Myxococcales bacterium]